MKAVVLSLEGGEGLRPIPTGGTLLGAPVLGRTLLEWNALALREAGVTELILALGPDAEVPAQAVLPMAVERFPAGTAEPEVLAVCARGAGEMLIALSGGVWWSGELHQALERHGRGGFTLTRVKVAGPARTGAGRILPFPEKGLGLAVCTPDLCPAPGEDWPGLFSRLRESGKLGAVELPGLWERADSPEGLVRVTAALLSARRLEAVPLRPGIWTGSPISEEVELVPPCAIGAGVTLGKNCLIGPHAVLEDGVCVGEHALVQRSILQAGAQVGSRAAVYGGVVCAGAVLGPYTVLNEGAAVGPEARIGDNAALMEGVRVSTGAQVPPSARLTEDYPSPAWTVEDMVRLGRRLGRCGLVGAGGGGFRGLLLARAFGCGAAGQGAAVVLHDGTLPQQAAWLAENYRWPASLFADDSGQIYLFDDRGQTLTAPPPDGETGPGSWDLLAGTAAAYTAAMERGDAPVRAAFRPCKGELL